MAKSKTTKRSGRPEKEDIDTQEKTQTQQPFEQDGKRRMGQYGGAGEPPVGMPGLNGFATCKQIRAQSSGKDIALIAVTGWAQYEVQQEAEEAGFDGILVKPVGAQKILAVIGSLLEGKAPQRPGA